MTLTRRDVLCGGSAFGALSLFNIGCASFGRSRAAQLRAGAPIRLAVIGCGAQGRALVRRFGAADTCEIAALCDPNPAAIEALRGACSSLWRPEVLATVPTYADYRTLFKECGPKLDAVVIATPNHHHALPLLMALRQNIHVFVETPLAHTLEEVNLIMRTARASSAIVHVGLASCGSSQRVALAQKIRSGAIGDISDVYSYSTRVRAYATRPAVCAAPKDVNWDLWCGGANVAKPHAAAQGQAALHLGGWQGWVDYGNGTVGAAGEVLAAPFEVMMMPLPEQVTVNSVVLGCPDSWNVEAACDFVVPAHKGFAATTLHWFEGAKAAESVARLVKSAKLSSPLPPCGTVFVGAKGVLFDTPEQADAVAGEMQNRACVADFLAAVRGKVDAQSLDLTETAPLTKTLMLANLAAFAGKGTWTFDGVRTDCKAANVYAKANYRPGWELTPWVMEVSATKVSPSRTANDHPYGAAMRSVRGEGFGTRSSGFGALER